MNGRSWWNVQQLKEEASKLPLEQFRLNNASKDVTLIRAVNAGIEKFFRIRIDGHRLQILASDGYPTQPILVDELFMSPGERINFRLYRIYNKQDHYLIRVMNGAELDWNYQRNQRMENQFTLALLSYKDDLPAMIPRIKQDCGSSDCRVLNCPFGSYPPEYGRRCIHIQQLNGKL